MGNALTPGAWADGPLPSNVIVGDGSVIHGEQVFRRFKSREPVALRVGRCTTLHSVQFAIGPAGKVDIGDWCYFTGAILLCELELRIGNYVRIGWNATIADSDFHPVDADRRIRDAIAWSPLGSGESHPHVDCAVVHIEDDVWIGPQVTILKGVRIGAGSYIEPGSVVTHAVPPRARVAGNPAKIVGEV